MASRAPSEPAGRRDSSRAGAIAANNRQGPAARSCLCDGDRCCHRSQVRSPGSAAAASSTQQQQPAHPAGQAAGGCSPLRPPAASQAGLQPALGSAAQAGLPRRQGHSLRTRLCAAPADVALCLQDLCSELKECANCHKTGANETWRVVKSQVYCNACGIYLRDHNTQRPQRLVEQSNNRKAKVLQNVRPRPHVQLLTLLCCQNRRLPAARQQLQSLCLQVS